MKQAKIDEKIYHKVRRTGLQSDRLYGLNKLYKNRTPIRPVLSIPSSSYENLIKILFPFFQRLPGENIETNSKDDRKSLEATKLKEDELVLSLDVRGLYTNVPVEGAIKIALKELYSSYEIPEVPRSNTQSCLRLALTNVDYK